MNELETQELIIRGAVSRLPSETQGKIYSAVDGAWAALETGLGKAADRTETAAIGGLLSLRLARFMESL